jgi:hypothetical protein
MKKLSFLLVALALFCFISLNSCKQKAGEAEEATGEMVEEAEEPATEAATADTTAAETEAAEETTE